MDETKSFWMGLCIGSLLALLRRRRGYTLHKSPSRESHSYMRNFQTMQTSHRKTLVQRLKPWPCCEATITAPTPLCSYYQNTMEQGQGSLQYNKLLYREKQTVTVQWRVAGDKCEQPKSSKVGIKFAASNMLALCCGASQDSLWIVTRNWQPKCHGSSELKKVFFVRQGIFREAQEELPQFIFWGGNSLHSLTSFVLEVNKCVQYN